MGSEGWLARVLAWKMKDGSVVCGDEESSGRNRIPSLVMELTQRYAYNCLKSASGREKETLMYGPAISVLTMADSRLLPRCHGAWAGEPQVQKTLEWSQHPLKYLELFPIGFILMFISSVYLFSRMNLFLYSNVLGQISHVQGVNVEHMWMDWHELCLDVIWCSRSRLTRLLIFH